MTTTLNETTTEKQPQTETNQVEHTRCGRFYRPNVDILERADELTVRADIPGANADDIDIQFENGSLTIHGRVRDRQNEGTDYLFQEYGIGDFYRSFQVGETVDPARITAEYKDGVLTLHLPKVEAAKPKKITVQHK